MTLIELKTVNAEVVLRKAGDNPKCSIKVNWSKPLDRFYKSVNIYIRRGKWAFFEDNDFHGNFLGTNCLIDNIKGESIEFNTCYTLFLVSVSLTDLENRNEKDVRRALVCTQKLTTIPPDVENFHLAQIDEGILMTWDDLILERMYVM